jgi:hypothetical protein
VNNKTKTWRDVVSFANGPSRQSQRRQQGRRIALCAISKRAAKHDKSAVKALRRDGVRPALAPERAFAAAGLRHARWQFVPR